MGLNQTPPYWQRAPRQRQRAALPRALCSAGEQRRNWQVSTKKGSVRIYYEEAGSGFPVDAASRRGIELHYILLHRQLAPSTPLRSSRGQYRCITADLRKRP